MNHKRTLLIAVFIGILLTASGFQTSPEYKILFEKAKFTMETKGDLNGAIALFNDIIKKYPKEREYSAKSQLYIGLCYEKLGNTEARKAYERVVRDYADQAESTKLARERLNALTIGKNISTNKTEVTMRRIWAGTKQPRGMSPDGRYLIISSGDLWLHDLKSGEERQITHEASDVDWTFSTGAAAISPDGKRIVYDWNVRSYRELRLSTLDGSSTQVLHSGQNGRDMYVCTWMPDNRQILAVSYSENQNQDFQLQIISLPDLTIHNIGQPDSKEIVGVRPSPEGRYISYSRKGDIFIYDTVTEQESVLVQNPSIDILAGWIPDGSGILFASDRSGTPDLYLLEIENGKPHGAPELIKGNVVNSTDFYYAKFYLTRDGQLFQLKNAGTTKSFISQVEEQTGKLTGTQALVDSNYPNVDGPGWSSDGKLFYYKISTLNEQFLFIRSEVTGQTHQITLKPKLEYWYHPVLSPDGRRFAVSGTDKNNSFGIFAIDSESGEVSQLVNIPTENVPVDPSQNWSPDGKAIFYKVRSPKESEEFIIRRKDLTTGEEKDIFHGIHTRNMKISSDGTRFVYFRNDMPTKSYVLGILDLQSGKEFEVWRVPVADSPEISDPMWAPDGKHILVAKSLKQGTELWRFPIAGVQGEKLHFFPEYSYGLVMHPSGTRIAFTQSRTNYELWVLENFLPKEKSLVINQLTFRKLDYTQLNTPSARLSPDGKKIAYQVYAGGSPKRFDMLDLNSGTTKVLLDSTIGDLSSMAWSPQSNKIAYAFRGRELYIRNLDGTNSQLISKSQEYKFYPFEWSRDSKKILCFFEGNDKTVRIGTITLDGKVQILKSSTGSSSGFVSEPRISPDGKYITCSLGERGGNTDIYVWASDDSRKVQVTTHPGRDESPVWSPDGKYLIFLSDRNRSADLWGVQMKDGETVGTPFMIKQDLGWRTEIKDLSANGKLFLFTVAGAEPVNLYTIPVDQKSGNLNGTITPVSFYPTAHSFPRYSPNGKMIAFLSRRGQISMPKLFVMDEKGAERELPLQGHYATNIAWHPENRSVLFTGWDKTNKSGVFEVSLDKGELKPVYSGEIFDMKTLKGAMVNINLLPDVGKIMFFRFLDKENVEVITCNPDGQQPEVVIPRVKMPLWGFPSPTGENICYRLGDSLMIVSAIDGKTQLIGTSTINLEASWSSNGDKLLFREGSNLKIFSVKEKIARTLYKASPGKTIGGMEMYSNTWSPNGNHVILTEQDTSAASVSPQKLILVNPADGSISVLGEAPKGYRMKELRWSPDGSRVMATGNSIRNVPASTYEYWVLENFLPK